MFIPGCIKANIAANIFLLVKFITVYLKIRLISLNTPAVQNDLCCALTGDMLVHLACLEAITKAVMQALRLHKRATMTSAHDWP